MGPRIAAVLALLLLAPAAARAAEADAFTVNGVQVDVTADSSAAARDQAIVQGQRKAFDQLLGRLAAPEDIARLPKLSDAEVTDLVSAFEVESEHVSTVRYIGSLTFHFRGSEVRRFLEGNSASIAETVSKPVLVVPVLTSRSGSVLWEDGNGWLAAWANRPPRSELVPLKAPLGDLDDVATIDAKQALAGDASRFAKLAARYGTGDTIVAEARLPDSGGKLRIHVVRYGPSGARDSFDDQVATTDAGADAAYPEAVERLAARIQEGWKQQNLVDTSVEQTLDVIVPIQQLSDWVQVQQRLRDVATLRRTDLIYLTRHEGRLNLVFAGDQAQLVRALSQRDLSLTQGSAGWVLVPEGQPGAAPPAQTDGSQPATN